MTDATLATDQTAIDIFNAVDRDALNSGVFGIGVHNMYNDVLVTAGQFNGISSAPSEIGYYSAAAGDEKDTLSIKLDGPLTDATAKVSFFYQKEGSGEQLTYELYLNGVKVGEETVTSDNGLSYSNSEPGFAYVKLDGFTNGGVSFDEVRFSGAPQTNTLDASDFLVESITGNTAGGLSPGYWKSHSSVWNDANENNHANTADFFSTADPKATPTLDNTGYFSELPDGVSNAVLAGGLTLREALGLNGGGEQALARQAVAALLNINSQETPYPITQDQLLHDVNAALHNNDAAATTALTNQLQTYNSLIDNHWV